MVKKAFLLFLCIALFAGFSVGVYAKDLQDGQFVIDIESQQNVDLVARKAKMSEILSEISKRAGVNINVKKEAGDELVSVSIKGKTLPEVLKEVIGNNYILVMKKTDLGFNVTKGKVLPTNEPIEEFFGFFTINGNRAKMFYTPPENTPESVAEYIKERHKFLDYLAKTDPSKIIVSQVSFKDFISANEFISFAKKYNLDIETINAGRNDCTGGFNVKQGESLEDALVSLNKSEEGFINRMVETSHQLNENGEISSEEAQKWEDYKGSFQESGTLVFGVKLKGSAQNLKNIKDTEGEVRLIDPITQGDFNNLLEQNFNVSQIAIPVSPFLNPISASE